MVKDEGPSDNADPLDMAAAYGRSMSIWHDYSLIMKRLGLSETVARTLCTQSIKLKKCFRNIDNCTKTSK